ncbi:MAG: hypothetical protein WDM81_08215 [Rhizomicrobium sp.]
MAKLRCQHRVVRRAAGRVFQADLDAHMAVLQPPDRDIGLPAQPHLRRAAFERRIVFDALQIGLLLVLARKVSMEITMK